MRDDPLRDAVVIEQLQRYVDSVTGGYRSTPPETTPLSGMVGRSLSDSYVSGRSLERWPGAVADFRKRWERHPDEYRRDLLTLAFPDADPVALLSGDAAPRTTHDEENTP